MTITRTVTGWRNYEFTTDLPCQRGCPPGTHALYVGMSARPDLRYGQHADASWRPYATGFVVHPEVYATEQDALDAEQARIWARLPYANREHNWANPCRLDFGPTVQRRPSKRRGRLVRAAASWRGQPRWVRRLAWRAVVWVAIAIVCFVATPNRVPFGTAVEGSVCGATLAVLAPLLGRRRRRRRHRRW